LHQVLLLQSERQFKITNMSENELKVLSDSIKQYTLRVANDKKESKKFLISVGILNQNGKFKKPYKKLCTLLETP